jgi:iron complex transport system ATP-binding protein
VIALSGGQVYDAGPPDAVVTPSLLREVFGVEADVVADPRTGVPLCIPHGLHYSAEERLTPNETEVR